MCDVLVTSRQKTLERCAWSCFDEISILLVPCFFHAFASGHAVHDADHDRCRVFCWAMFFAHFYVCDDLGDCLFHPRSVSLPKLCSALWQSVGYPAGMQSFYLDLHNQFPHVSVSMRMDSISLVQPGFRFFVRHISCIRTLLVHPFVWNGSTHFVSVAVCYFVESKCYHDCLTQKMYKENFRIRTLK